MSFEKRLAKEMAEGSWRPWPRADRRWLDDEDAFLVGLLPVTRRATLAEKIAVAKILGRTTGGIIARHAVLRELDRKMRTLSPLILP